MKPLFPGAHYCFILLIVSCCCCCRYCRCYFCAYFFLARNGWLSVHSIYRAHSHSLSLSFFSIPAVARIRLLKRYHYNSVFCCCFVNKLSLPLPPAVSFSALFDIVYTVFGFSSHSLKWCWYLMAKCTSLTLTRYAIDHFFTGIPLLILGWRVNEPYFFFISSLNGKTYLASLSVRWKFDCVCVMEKVFAPQTMKRKQTGNKKKEFWWNDKIL